MYNLCFNLPYARVENYLLYENHLMVSASQEADVKIAILKRTTARDERKINGNTVITFGLAGFPTFAQIER